jgi:hypothetical protein
MVSSTFETLCLKRCSRREGLPLILAYTDGRASRLSRFIATEDSDQNGRPWPELQALKKSKLLLSFLSIWLNNRIYSVQNVIFFFHLNYLFIYSLICRLCFLGGGNIPPSRSYSRLLDGCHNASGKSSDRPLICPFFVPEQMLCWWTNSTFLPATSHVATSHAATSHASLLQNLTPTFPIHWYKYSAII